MEHFIVNGYEDEVFGILEDIKLRKKELEAQYSLKQDDFEKSQESLRHLLKLRIENASKKDPSLQWHANYALH